MNKTYYLVPSILFYKDVAFCCMGKERVLCSYSNIVADVAPFAEKYDRISLDFESCVFVCNEDHSVCGAIRELIASKYFKAIRFDFSSILVENCCFLSFPETCLIKRKYSFADRVPLSFEIAFNTKMLAKGHVQKLFIHWNSPTPSYLDSCNLLNSLESENCNLESLHVYFYVPTYAIEENERQIFDFADYLVFSLSKTFDRLKNNSISIPIRNLNLSFLHASANSIISLLNSLISSGVQLKSLNLSDNFLSQECFDTVARYIDQDFCILESLRLSNTAYNDEDLSEKAVWVDPTRLFNSLERNKTVKILDVRKMYCTNVGVFALKDLLCVNKTLKSVDFSDNWCSLEDAKYAVKHKNPYWQLLTTNNTLEKLHLCDTVETDEEWEFIFDAIRDYNYSLTRISHQYYCFHCHSGIANKINTFLERNRLLQWKDELHVAVLELAVGIFSLRLPSYVALEIFDWFPTMANVKHWPKITLIQNVFKSCQKVVNLGSSSSASRKSE